MKPNLPKSDHTQPFQRLAKAEIIKIPVPIQPTPRENSLMKFAGIFQNDPDFLEIIKEIGAEREDNSDI